MTKIRNFSVGSFILWFMVLFLGVNQVSYAQEDPLIPQQFAFDKANNVFAGICKANNTIDIINYKNDKLDLNLSILVDTVAGRHDVKYIYTPKSVAIYEDFIVFLASHIDSCYLAVLDLDGNIKNKYYFKGRASAFSYNPLAKELYIAGENEIGYDIAVLGTEKGFDNLLIDENKNFHYQKPKKAEEMFRNDPTGSALAIIAMSVVFLVLLILFLCFKYIGSIIILFQSRRAKQAIAKTQAINNTQHLMPNEVSGETYAAIAAAIYLYNDELHDIESGVLTIIKSSRAYSPWSAKTHGHNNNLSIKKNK